MSPQAPVLLEADAVVRTYRMGARRGEEPVEVHALRGVTFRVDRGDYVAIVGSSGSGKSTLLNLLGALDRPTTGEVRYDGRDVRTMDDTELAALRNGSIGFVFQSFHLLPRLSAVDNVQLPLIYRRGGAKERREQALEALTAVGLADRVEHRPTELSGGQQQRVAIARALVTEPPLLLADEPTGNLDTATGDDIMTLLERLHTDRGMAVVVITHELDIAARADRRIELRDGEVVTHPAPNGPRPDGAARDAEAPNGAARDEATRDEATRDGAASDGATP